MTNSNRTRPPGAIYDPRLDNLTCLLPAARPGEVWTRSCRVHCAMCDDSEEFFVVTGAPVQELANKSLSEVMAQAGWTYGGDNADEDFCPKCSRVGA